MYGVSSLDELRQIALQQIAKTYRANGVHALSGVDFVLKSGELHTVAGENGAGKSTLMHILGGFIKPDSGKILLDGKQQHFSAPAAALRAGIGMVRQRPALVEQFSVWENCALGRAAGTGGGFFFNRKKAREAAVVLAAKLGFRLPLDSKAGELTLAGQKKTAVLSLVMRGASFFIFDEPLAYLRRDEKDEMRELFLSLRNAGKGVAVIAHEIQEMFPISDRITVLRNGRVVLSGAQNMLDEAQVVAAMFGKLADTTGILKKKTQILSGGSVLSVENLRVNDSPGFYPLENINLEVRRGEIVGIAGARESGVGTLERTLAGFIKPDGGAVTIHGMSQSKTVGTAGANQGQGGFAYIGLGSNSGAFAPSLSVRDNLILHKHWKRANGWGFLDRKALSGFAASLVAGAGLSMPVDAPVSSLSGGMLARIIAERELAKEADVLLLSDPSAGLDLQALNALLVKIRKFADAGGGVLLFLGGVSFDRTIDETVNRTINQTGGAAFDEPGSLSGAHELAEICDRVYFIENGRIVSHESGEFGRTKTAEFSDSVQPVQPGKTTIKERRSV
jgi:simple sugar transport system ATP-binding protein